MDGKVYDKLFDIALTNGDEVNGWLLNNAVVHRKPRTPEETAAILYNAIEFGGAKLYNRIMEFDITENRGTKNNFNACGGCAGNDYSCDGSSSCYSCKSRAEKAKRYGIDGLSSDVDLAEAYKKLENRLNWLSFALIVMGAIIITKNT